eukprot:PhF_6_TR25084/c0_g1_i5/m.34432
MDRPSQPPAESNALVALQAQVTSLQQSFQDFIEATKNKDPPQCIQFVGGAHGWSTWTGDRFSNDPNAGVTGPAAYERARKDFMAWKASNPTVRVLSERLEIVGIPWVYNGNNNQAGACATAI